MRIAVCRPQVPFAYGGAEIFTDTLVEQLRARGHEAEIVSVPFKWYPGTQVLTQAFLWRLLDLTESDGQADRHGRRDQVPVVRRAAPREAGLARAPVPAGLRARPHRRSGSSPRVAEDRAVRRKVQDLDRVALGEASRLFATSGNVAGRLAALDGARRRGAAPSRRRSSPTTTTATGTSSSRSTGSIAPSASTC